jgi:lipid A 3-O-deacylase
MAAALFAIAGISAQALAEDPYTGQYHRVLRAQDMAQNTARGSPDATQGRAYRRATPPNAPIPVAQETQVAQNAQSLHHRGKPLLGIISELRGGFLDHDSGIFGRNKEGGNDYNFEALFVSPELFDFMWSPRPMLGGTVNDDGDTSRAYGGLTWEWWPLDSVFIDFSFGFAVHDGNIDDNELGRKDFGSRVLFRESLELGWNFYNRDRISIILDHISHGHAFGDPNEGMDSLGVRYGYRF